MPDYTPSTRTTCFVTLNSDVVAKVDECLDKPRIAAVLFGSGLTLQAFDISASQLAERLEAAAAQLRRIELELDANARPVPHGDVAA